MGYMNNGNEDRSRRQDMGYGMESNTEYDMEPKMGEDADYDGKRGPDSDAGSDADCNAACDRDQGMGRDKKADGKNLSEHFLHIGMLLHRYQTEAYKENGPMGSPFKGQGRILAILKLKPEISHRELSYLLGISTQSMSELLRKLENKGYVKRVPGEHDRRSMDIILTEEGRRAVEQADGFDGRDTDRLFDCFDNQEQRQFKGFLERLEDEIIRHLDPEHPSDYTFDRMKEMHDYILSRGRREHCHHHGDGPLGNGFGRGPHEDERDPGRRFDRRRR